MHNKPTYTHTARLKTFTVGEVVGLISNHGHADTVQIEAVQILRTACKRKATDTACERPCSHRYGPRMDL